jgi:hypothetical protein
MSVEFVSYMGIDNCVKLSNGSIDVIATTAVGPRVLFFGPTRGANIFGEHPDVTYNSALGTWRPYGGHRLWAWPELFPATYAPDNDPIQYSVTGDLAVTLRQSIDGSGLEKEISLELSVIENRVKLRHAITSHSLWPIEIALWPITVVASGTAIVPRVPYVTHAESVVVAQPLNLWAFTDLQDSRFTLGSGYVMLTADSALSHPQKFGLYNRQGWCAHLVGQNLFVKRFSNQADAKYPDFGSNNEVYVEGDFMEVELLGPVQTVVPGKTISMQEEWTLFENIGIDSPSDVERLDEVLAPLIQSLF